MNQNVYTKNMKVKSKFLEVANNVFFILNFLFTLIFMLMGSSFGIGSGTFNTLLGLMYASWVLVIFATIDTYNKI